MEEILQSFGVGRRPVNDPFFNQSYDTCKIFKREGVAVIDEEELCHQVIKEFSCTVPLCKKRFETVFDFEMHYNSCHRYICAECNTSRQNAKLLEIHVLENHDSLFKVLSESQPMYQCYVSSCDIKFKTAADRTEHCIRDHKFPKNYRFDTQSSCKNLPTNDGRMEIEMESTDKVTKNCFLNNQKSRTFIPGLNSRNFHKAGAQKSEASHIGLSTVSKIGSPLMFIPRQVQIPYAKKLTKNQSDIKDVLQRDDMMDLAEALPK